MAAPTPTSTLNSAPTEGKAAPLKVRPSASYGPGRRTFRDLYGEDIVDIYVGPDEVHFRVHKRVLCDRVPYFKKMFKGDFKEGVENVARFPVDDPDSFDMLVDWIYFYNVRALGTLEGPDGEDITTWDPVKFYSSAEKFCLPIVQDCIMDTVIKHHKKTQTFPSLQFIDETLEMTSDNSPLRQYVLQSLRYIERNLNKEDSEQGWPAAGIQDLWMDHRDFMCEYIQAVREGARDDPRDEPKCEFHVHGKDGPCITNDWDGKRKYYTPPQPKSNGDRSSKKQRIVLG